MGSGLDLYGGARTDGVPIEISLSPLETEDGSLVSSAIRDVTDRRNIEDALQVANRELEAFSYSVAHDLRAPLRGMNGFARLLLDTYKDSLDTEGQDWLQEIVQNAQRMGALIDALLSLSRVTRTGAASRAGRPRGHRRAPRRRTSLPGIGTAPSRSSFMRIPAPTPTRSSSASWSTT